MRLVFAGTPQVALPSLDALLASHHEVVAVVTRPDAPSGRGRKLSPSPVGARATELGIEVLKPEHPRDPEFQRRLRELAPEAGPVVAYGALLPEEVLTIPVHGWLNLHFSALPRWRGAAPVQRAIMAGDATIGTSCFRIVPELDAGDLYSVREHQLPEATAGEVLAQLAEVGATQLVAALDAMESGKQPRPQGVSGISYAPKITVPQARIDFSLPALQVRNHILGCSPEPGAWCELDGNRLKIYRARLAEANDLCPGAMQVTKRQVFVGTGTQAVELLEVQAPGKKRMAAIDWARSGVGSGQLR